MRNLLPICFCCLLAPQAAKTQEITVLPGYDAAIEWQESLNWWGEELRGEQLQAPRTLLVAISPRWRENAPQMPVAMKKEFFYRALLPLVAHANSLVLDRRGKLTRLDEELAKGRSPTAEEVEALQRLAVVLRIRKPEEAAAVADTGEWREIIAEALYRLDVIPAGLPLGQAAYESGYGTSRFTVEGNALFGQWSFGGEGLAPQRQRKELGNYGIAAFEWPFDSVRGYFLNLSSHPAYADFRRIRAELKAAGKPVTSLALADGLLKYSERGQEYVDTLKGIIRTNHFDLADNVTQRDEPLGFAFGVADEDTAQMARARIEEMRKSGELEEIVARMRLD